MVLRYDLYSLIQYFKKNRRCTDAEAKEVVTNIANSKDMAAKADIKDIATKEYIKAEIAKLGTRLVKQMYAGAGIIIVVNTAAVGIIVALIAKL